MLRHKDALFVKTEIHAFLPDSVISRTLGHAPCMPPGPAIPNRRPFHALHALFRSAGASLENAVITGANFNGADLTGVNFEDALVGNGRWNNARARLAPTLFLASVGSLGFEIKLQIDFVRLGCRSSVCHCSAPKCISCFPVEGLSFAGLA